MNFGVCPEGVSAFPLDLPEALATRSLGWHRSSKNPSVRRFVELVRATDVREE